MTTTLMLAALATASAADPAPLTVSASMPDTIQAKQTGAETALVVRFDVADGWSTSEAGMPEPILQIEVPDSVTLSGPVLTELRALARNEFIQAPYEWRLKERETRIPFTLSASPSADEHVALNVIAYMKQGEGDAVFVRQRLQLPVVAGATATAADPGVSTWGDKTAGLQIGDRADAFSLPRADGTTVSLSDYRDRKHVLVTTYRAFW